VRGGCGTGRRGTAQALAPALATALATVLAMLLAVGCGDDDETTDRCGETTMTFTQEADLARSLVVAGAGTLGLAGTPEERNEDGKLASGKDDPSVQVRRVHLRDVQAGEVDLVSVVDTWAADFDAEAVVVGDERVEVAVGEVRAAAGTGRPNDAGERTVWVEASTGCHPAAEVAPP
jgi:hypothetical protein